MTRQIAMTSFDSTSIAAGGYDTRSRTLRLRYIDGDVYDYSNVPSRVFVDLLDAPSKGRFVNWHVKPNYPYVRVTRVNGRARDQQASPSR
jgi:hypothetical protein